MTTQMVCKQIYIEKRQELLLKQLSKARGLSEAEIIRQVFELELRGSNLVQVRHLSTMDEFFGVASKNH